MQPCPSIKKPSPMSLTRIGSRTSEFSKNRSKEFDQEGQQLPPTAYKKKVSIFLTQKKFSQVQQIHKQLNSYIDSLDNRVTKFIEKNQMQFVGAYRNHIKKVREEMQIIRSTALKNASTTASQTEKIEALEKQLIVFREESLRLFEKVYDRQKIIANLQNKIKEIEMEKNYLQKNVRVLMKRNKQLQGNKCQAPSNYKTLEQNNESKQFQIIRPQNIICTTENINTKKINFEKIGLFCKTRSSTTAANSQNIQYFSKNQNIELSQRTNPIDIPLLITQIQTQIDERMGSRFSMQIIHEVKSSIAEILKSVNNFCQQKTNRFDFPKVSLSKQKQLKLMMCKASRSVRQSKYQIKLSQMQELFCKSIEIVQKQIARRKGNKNLNFYQECALMNFQEFKKVDYFRLLEIVFSHQKILEVVHQTIFQEVNRTFT